MKLLVVEDDASIRTAICELLQQWGYVSEEAHDGQAALQFLEHDDFDLVILDLNLPKLDGLEVCRRLRNLNKPQPLVLMLTARDTISDNITGLEKGADDYLVKPFDPQLLKARIKALLRRSERPLQDTWSWGHASLTADGRTASFLGEDLELTPKEHLILEELLRAAGRTRSKEQLIQLAWGGLSSPGEESVKTHVKNLRAKLTGKGAPPDFVETVYGVGFRLNANHAA